MSDPMTNREIEDVLSSIRRLVSEDGRPAVRPDSAATTPLGLQPVGRLMLTPAFRVADESVPNGTGALKLAVPPTVPPTITPTITPTGPLPAPASPKENLLQSANLAARQDVMRTWQHEAEGLADLEEDEPETITGLADPLRPARFGSRPPEVAGQTNNAGRDQSVSRSGNKPSAQNEKALGAEPLVVPLAETITIPVEADVWSPSLDNEADLPSPTVDENAELPDPEPAVQRRPFWAAPSDEMARLEATIAELEAAVAASAQDIKQDSAGVLAEAGLDAAVVAAMTRQMTGPSSPPRRLHLGTAMVEPDPIEAPHPLTEPEQSSLFDGLDDTIMDEAALRELVIEVIRQELQGALGERITRNVRKLVRAEIHRALAGREFD